MSSVRPPLIVSVLILSASLVGCEPSSSSGSMSENAPAAKPDESAAHAPAVTAKPAENPPENAGLEPGTEAQAQLLVRAKAAFLRDDWSTARGHFEELTRTGPVSGPQVTAYLALSQIVREEDGEKAALALLEELLKKAPDVPEVNYMGARALAEAGETGRAIGSYRRTIELQPDYLAAYVELGGLLTKAGREQEAGDIFLKYEAKIYHYAQQLEKPGLDPAEQLGILEIFSFIDDDRAAEAIAKALNADHPQVRERAVQLIQEMGIGAALPRLKAMAEADSDVAVRVAAEAAVKRLASAPIEGGAPTFVREDAAK